MSDMGAENRSKEFFDRFMVEKKKVDAVKELTKKLYADNQRHHSCVIREDLPCTACVVQKWCLQEYYKLLEIKLE